MKRNIRLLLLLMATLLLLPIGVVSSDAAVSLIRRSLDSDVAAGYTCTNIYHEGEIDQGYAAARSTTTNFIIIKKVQGHAMTECTNVAYMTRLATGYASYKLNGVNRTEYHLFETNWYTNQGEAIWGASDLKVTVCYAETSNGKTYRKLTGYVTDY